MKKSDVEDKLEQTIDAVNSYNKDLLGDVEAIKQSQKLQKLDADILRKEVDKIHEEAHATSKNGRLTIKEKVLVAICYITITLLLIVVFNK
jgi:hypothetical protein